jgi:hypothetical protein
VRAKVGQETADMPGRTAADIEDEARAARGGEAAQALDVPRLARELVGEVRGVLLGDPIERRADGIDGRG